MRKKLDAYYTPRTMAFNCVHAMGVRENVRCLEPSAGGGAFADPLLFFSKQYPVTVDLDESTNPEYHGNFLEIHDKLGTFDVIAGNPPYSHALEFVQAGLSILNPGGSLGFLLRLGFLASQRRSKFFAENPVTELHILSKRPSFTGDGRTDGSEYAFFVWRKGSEQQQKIKWI